MNKLYAVECNVDGSWSVCQTFDTDGIECAAIYFTKEDVDEAYTLWADAGGNYRVRDISVSEAVVPFVSDIHGQKVVVGDYVAYASQGYQLVLEVADISVNTGIVTCRNIANGRMNFYGTFFKHALKLKDYTK